MVQYTSNIQTLGDRVGALCERKKQEHDKQERIDIQSDIDNITGELYTIFKRQKMI